MSAKNQDSPTTLLKAIKLSEVMFLIPAKVLLSIANIFYLLAREFHFF